MAAVSTSRTTTSSANLSRSLSVNHVRLLPSKGASAKRLHLSYAAVPAATISGVIVTSTPACLFLGLCSILLCQGEHRPIFTGFSRSVVSDQCSTSFGNASGRVKFPRL